MNYGKYPLDKTDINAMAISTSDKYKGANFAVGDTYVSLRWKDETITKPTESEFDECVSSWKLNYEAQEYARNRQAEYP